MLRLEVCCFWQEQYFLILVLAAVHAELGVVDLGTTCPSASSDDVAGVNGDLIF